MRGSPLGPRGECRRENQSEGEPAADESRDCLRPQEFCLRLWKQRAESHFSWTVSCTAFEAEGDRGTRQRQKVGFCSPMLK